MSVIIQESDIPSQDQLNEAVGRLRKDAELMLKTRGKSNTEDVKSFTSAANFLEMIAKKINRKHEGPEVCVEDVTSLKLYMK